MKIKIKRPFNIGYQAITIGAFHSYAFKATSYINALVACTAIVCSQFAFVNVYFFPIKNIVLK